MKIATGWSTHSDAAAAAREALHSMSASLGAEPKWVFASFSAEYPVDVVRSVLRELCPSAQLHGGTGCLGAMTERGFHSNGGIGIALLGVSDAGTFGVGACSLGQDSRRAAAEAVRAALAQAGRPGEMPELVWLSGAPGREEEVLLGIEDVVGRVPIAGGSSADNRVAGGWHQIANDRSYADAVVVTVMFPTAKISYAFLSGYSPTDKIGRVTRAQGRTLYEIDGRPAALVYNEWSGGLLKDVLGSETNILNQTTLLPFGRIVGSAGGLPYYRLSHPETVRSDGALTLFTSMQEGDRISLMSGSIDSLVTRAGRVASSALSAGDMRAEDASGALVIYCAGCMLAVRERMEDVVDTVNDVLKGMPFLGMFTFGEQGCFIGGENRHGNLMMSVVVFGK
jgi:hypothetical protein